MGNFRRPLLQIEGCTVALAGSEVPLSVIDWGIQKAGLVAPSTGQSISVSLETFTGDTGGNSVLVGDLSELLTNHKTEPITDLNGSIDDTDTIIKSSLASGLFPSSGHIWIEKEAIEYSGISGIHQFLNCTRGALGTTAKSHNTKEIVHGFMPTLLHRQVWMYWVSGNTKKLRFSGFIDNVDFGDGSGFSMSILSTKKQYQDSPVLFAPYARGKLHFTIGTTAEGFFLELEDRDVPFPDNRQSTYKRAHLQIEEEIIEYHQSVYPAHEMKVFTSLSSVPKRMSIDSGNGGGLLKPGISFDIIDNNTGLLGGEGYATSNIEQLSGSNNIDYNSDYQAVSDDIIKLTYQSFITKPNQKRGYANTEVLEHKTDAEILEIRILEGDQIEDILFPLLFSVEGKGVNGPDNGKFDVLPPYWGLGMSQTVVDLPAFEALVGFRSAYRRYVRKEEMKLSELLEWIARSCNAFVFWDERGVLTCNPLEDIYPNSSANKTITQAETRPTWKLDATDLVNYLEIKSDYDLQTGEYNRTLKVEISGSVKIYGRHEMAVLEDPGLVASRANTQIYTTIFGVLILRSRPLPTITLDVPLDEDQPYYPGDAINLQIPHVPNMAGGTGIDGIFLVLAVQPDEPNVKTELTLIHRGVGANVALISPVGLVEAVDGPGKLITFQPSSYTHFAPSGKEDIDYFLNGDKITLWDRSTLGGAIAKHDALVLQIDYPNRIIEVDALPVFPLVPDDIIRLQRFDNYRGGLHEAARLSRYLILAGGSPTSIDGDAPKVWGV